jgi:hypothetical protein
MQQLCLPMKPDKGEDFSMRQSCALLLFLVLAGPCFAQLQSEDGLVALPATEGELIPASYFAAPADKGAWTKGNFKITPYGAFWADMLYASERTNPGAFSLYVFSEELQGEDTFTIDARRSRFGIDVAGPEIPFDCGMETSGQLEIDFHGNFVNENQTTLQIRHAYWQARNERQRILVGQYWDVISPLYMHTLDYAVGWASGDIGFRRAQFRYERFGSVTDDLAWTLQTSLNQDIVTDFSTTAGIVRENSDWPVIESRFALTLHPEAGPRAATLGFSGHIGENGFDFNTPGPPPLSLPPEDDARFETWSVNMDLSVPVRERSILQATVFHGRNLSAYLGGILQGVCPCNREGLRSTGGWVDLQTMWTDTVRLAYGYGVDDPKNSDFMVGRVYNQIFFANVLKNFSPNLSSGIEVAYRTTLYQETRQGLIPDNQLGPTAPGKAVILDWMVKYEF